MTRRVVLVCGPPGAGKTTWAHASGLTVYDRDDPQWAGEHHFRTTIARLATDPTAHAAVIRTGATTTSRATARRLIGATDTVMLAVDAATCRQRITARKQPGQSIRTQLAAVDTWWARYQPDHPDPALAAVRVRRGGSGDPRLKTPEWRAIVRYWQDRRDPLCRRCMGELGPIDYGPVRNRLSLDVGHIEERDGDHRQVWRIADTQPEHAHCNRSAGAHYGHTKQVARRPAPVTSRSW